MAGGRLHTDLSPLIHLAACWTKSCDFQLPCGKQNHPTRRPSYQVLPLRAGECLQILSDAIAEWGHQKDRWSSNLPAPKVPRRFLCAHINRKQLQDLLSFSFVFFWLRIVGFSTFLTRSQNWLNMGANGPTSAQCSPNTGNFRSPWAVCSPYGSTITRSMQY